MALLKIDGYNCLLNFDPEDCNLGISGIRGVAIYYKESLNVNEVDFHVDGCRDHAWIEICTGNNMSLLCGCIYRTQSKDLECDGCIKTAYHQNKSILIAGDFNYKEIDWEREYAPHTDTHLIDFIETLQECFLYQHVSEQTRHREGDRSNLLDLILSSEEGMVQNLTYHPPLGESDHVIPRFNVPFDRSEKVNGWIAKPDVFKTNYEVLKEEMLRYDWDEILTSNFQEAYDSFFEILPTALEKHSLMQPLLTRGRTSI